MPHIALVYQHIAVVAPAVVALVIAWLNHKHIQKIKISLNGNLEKFLEQILTTVKDSNDKITTVKENGNNGDTNHTPKA